uniref:Type I polyketide synthase n=1 Tax=Gambierdiscus excentricus TaxID=986170 RepID=A0A1S6K8A6_9DINO|nr:type I polyketide synthase [Gambierdiscus excentricus]
MMAAALAGPSFDVSLAQPEHTVGPSIVQLLASKGFAVLRQDYSDSFRDGVLNNVKAIDAAGQLKPPPRLVAEGLLGERGTARLCQLGSPEEEAHEWEGSAIRFADRSLSQIGELLEPLVPDLGITLLGRTPGVLLETADAADEPPELTDDEAQQWLSTFTCAKLLVLQFLGPSVGTLELRVVDGDDDTEPYFVQTGPGVMVVLRADVLLHEHTSPGLSYALSTFACGERVAWFKRQYGDDLHPAAKAIDQWIVGRLMEVKKTVAHVDETSLNPTSIPRSMQKMMNKMFVKGERSAIRGTSCKFANAFDVDIYRNTMTAGVDYVVEVPLQRWNHVEHYHPDLEGYHYGKVYCMHLSYCPELEMFDNKFFLISPAEASKMDPCERQILEVGYEGLARGGLKKREIMGSDCGIYVAWQSETAVGSEDRGMGANRASFCLGCKGPSLACDVDHASALLAIKVASNELGRACNQGIAIGCSILQVVNTWLVHCGSHILSPAGRTCSFDANASGFVRADSISSVFMKKLAEKVDGEDIWDEKVAMDGVIVSTICKNQGRTASLRSVSGPCVQETFDESLRQAKVSPLDIDIVECDAKGDVMQDGVEVAAIVRAVRPPRQNASDDEPVTLGASKSNLGNAWMASGMSTVIKGLMAGLYGTTPPIVHLNQVNPLIHSEAFGQAVTLPNECVDIGSDVSYTSMLAFGWGGTNAQITVWNKVDVNRIYLGRPDPIEKPVFWPGGGGVLESGQQPKMSYTIVGTWSSWVNPSKMEREADGVFGYTVTLGENCWELFQIWLDGDEDLVLHPGRAKAPKATTVAGPQRVGVHLSWLIDGRAVLEQDVEMNEGNPSTLMMQPYAGSGGADGMVELPHGDRGWPGAEYRVRLRVAGKWRTVDWERISDVPGHLRTEALSDTVKGRYFVTGSFNHWSFQEMSADFVSTGVYNAEIMLAWDREQFQIVRNEDWQQMIYPVDRLTSELSPIGGPDDAGHGCNWTIRGQAGDVFRIEFQRSLDDTGFQSMKVSWRRVRSQQLEEKILKEARRTKYFLVGSWNSYRARKEMVWRGTHFEAEVSTLAKESFQILMNGDWGAVLFPNIDSVNPQDVHRLCGPSAESGGLGWSIGEDPKDDTDGLSQTHEIRLIVSQSGRPTKLQCTTT